MKIAFSGAHRVGKTSLAEKIHASLPEFFFVPEPYVALEEQGRSFSHTPNLEDLTLQIEHAIETVEMDELDVIFDRCPLDLLAYIYVIGGAEASRKYYLQVKEAMEEIDLLVFVPIESPDEIGCPEAEFPQLRRQVNDLLEEWIDAFDLETILVNGTPAEREKQVIEAILRFD
ncbi:AAA family ATPase [Fluviicola chungangensis]|uniref:AAA family ATPase n=1 Tax=Fluviicola chungangensis TaxID=2597671 RepID=A0A556MJK2_9FLAO|nr:AAA family ATPase [Fluviicola chungangensis]TSJ40084.1 AAA family ATPase [Fluviicola chungangensis]